MDRVGTYSLGERKIKESGETFSQISGFYRGSSVL